MDESKYQETIKLADRIGADWRDPDFQFGCYVYCVDFHGGQWSPEYRALCEIPARLSDKQADAIRRGHKDPHGEWEESRNFYRQLKRSYPWPKKAAS